MSASFQLTLDTTAPEITWGAVSGATAGERLRVGYTLNEPGVAEATVELPDGRTLALVDTGLTLEANLPVDAAAGWATVRARLVDDVWNEATRALPVRIAGVVVTPEPDRTPAGGLPGRARRRARPDARTLRVRSRVHATSSSRARALERSYVGIAVASSPGRLSAMTDSTDAVSIMSRAALTSSRAVGRDSTRTLSREGTVTRRDGPDAEALLLDLI